MTPKENAHVKFPSIWVPMELAKFWVVATITGKLVYLAILLSLSILANSFVKLIIALNIHRLAVPIALMDGLWSMASVKLETSIAFLIALMESASAVKKALYWTQNHVVLKTFQAAISFLLTG